MIVKSFNTFCETYCAKLHLLHMQPFFVVSVSFSDCVPYFQAIAFFFLPTLIIVIYKGLVKCQNNFN